MSIAVIILLVIAVIGIIAGVIGATVLYMNAKQLIDENEKLREKNQFLEIVIEEQRDFIEDLFTSELIK